MRICDRCGDKNGVNQHRVSFAMVYMVGWSEKQNELCDYTADLCSVCAAKFREYACARYWLAFIHGGDGSEIPPPAKAGAK